MYFRAFAEYALQAVKMLIRTLAQIVLRTVAQIVADIVIAPIGG